MSAKRARLQDIVLSVLGGAEDIDMIGLADVLLDFVSDQVPGSRITRDLQERPDEFGDPVTSAELSTSATKAQVSRLARGIHGAIDVPATLWATNEPADRELRLDLEPCIPFADCPIEEGPAE